MWEDDIERIDYSRERGDRFRSLERVVFNVVRENPHRHTSWLVDRAVRVATKSGIDLHDWSPHRALRCLERQRAVISVVRHDVRTERFKRTWCVSPDYELVTWSRQTRRALYRIIDGWEHLTP